MAVLRGTLEWFCWRVVLVSLLIAGMRFRGGWGPLVGLVRRQAHATLPFLKVVAPTRSIAPLLRRKAASGDLSGRDFGAGREESPEGRARGWKGEMPERRVFKLTAGSKGKGTGVPAVYQSCSARVERLLRDGRVNACRFDGFHNKGATR